MGFLRATQGIRKESLNICILALGWAVRAVNTR